MYENDLLSEYNKITSGRNRSNMVPFDPNLIWIFITI